MRLAAQERRREGNEPQTTKVAHHTTYPRHAGFEVEIKDEDADAVGTSPESTAVVEFGVMPVVSRLQPSNVGLDAVGSAAGGVSDGQGMEVEVRAELDNSEWSAKADLSEKSARKLIRDLEDALRDLEEARIEAEEDRSYEW